MQCQKKISEKKKLNIHSTEINKNYFISNEKCVFFRQQKLNFQNLTTIYA